MCMIHRLIKHTRTYLMNVSRSSRDRLEIVSRSLRSSRDRLVILSRFSRHPLEMISISSLDLLEIILKSIWYHLSTHTQHTHTSRTLLEIVSRSSRDRPETVSRSSRDRLEIISGSSREHVTTNMRALTHSRSRTHTRANIYIYISCLYIAFKNVLSRKVVPRVIKIRKGHGNFEDRMSYLDTTKQKLTVCHGQESLTHAFLTPDGPIVEMVYNSPPPFYTPASVGTVKLF